MQMALTAPRLDLSPTTPGGMKAAAAAEPMWGNRDLSAGGSSSGASPQTLGGLRLSSFSGGFRIDEPGETMLLCGEPI